MASTGLIVVGTVVGGLTANPSILGSISGAGLALKTFSETKDNKKRIELSKFCYTTYSKVLVELNWEGGWENGGVLLRRSGGHQFC